MLPNFQFYQIVVVLIALFMIYLGVNKYLRHQATQTFLKLAVRIVVWGGMATVAAFPDVTNTLADFIGIEGNINAVVLIGFLLVFLIIFKILSVVERIEQEISTITRDDALDELKKDNKHKQS